MASSSDIPGEQRDEISSNSIGGITNGQIDLFIIFQLTRLWAWNQNERTKEPKKTKGRVRVSPIEHLQKSSPKIEIRPEDSIWARPKVWTVEPFSR
jgi:hypothetical protein